MAGERTMGQDGVSARERREKIQGSMVDPIEAWLGNLDAELPAIADRFVFTDVWGRPGLSHEERVLVAVAHLTTGKHIGPLRSYLRGGLEFGVKTRKLHETLIMALVYCGFAVALDALQAWKEVLKDAGRTLGDDD